MGVFALGILWPLFCRSSELAVLSAASAHAHVIALAVCAIGVHNEVDLPGWHGKAPLHRHHADGG